MSLDALRNEWTKDKSLTDFSAQPDKGEGRTRILTRWTCYIPGKAGTDWEGVKYKMTMEFNDYPNKPPLCKFPEGFYHPNVYPTGEICMEILDEERGWHPDISIRQILVAVQNLLDQPNSRDPAQPMCYHEYSVDQALYRSRVRDQAAAYANNN